MKFKSWMILLGKVKKGEKCSFKFEFINIGDMFLEIFLVLVCDCIIIDYFIDLVVLGKMGVINVIFDSIDKDEFEVIDVDVILENVDFEMDYLIIE